MASDLPDHKSLKSWEDAFAHPVSMVHQLEQQLRGDIGANRERLRTLVGASYRDLLRTAERIVDMDAQLRTVESNLGDIGQKCNARAVERVERNVATWTQGRGEGDRLRYAFTCQLALLQACPIVISRLLRKKGSTLLAAKILVISRLVHKSLSKDGDTPPFVEDLWTQLVALRARLLRRIDRLLASSDAASATVVEAMCAYSLATSSAATDVLRHFHHARLEAIKSTFEAHDVKHENLIRGLRLYTQTLHDTLSIMPNSLSESLSRLKKHPLLQDPEIRAVPELALDIHSRWLDHDIRNFTPWVRHDDLSKLETEKQLKVWTKKAFSATLHGLKEVLESVEDFKLLVQLRRQVLEQWFEGKRRISSYLTSDSLGDIRSAITHQLIQLVHAKASRLHLVGTEIEATLQDWRPGINHAEEGLWSDSLVSMDIGNGAHRFKTAVLDRFHGRDERVLRALNSYRTWHTFVDEAMTAVKTMRNSSWDEDLDEDEDELLDSRNDLLSSEDPTRVEEELDKALKEAFISLGDRIDQIVRTVAKTRPKAVYVLRLLREIGSNLPDRQIGDEHWGQTSRIYLQHIIAQDIVNIPLEKYRQETKIQVLAKKIPARALWEGSPAYPIQPSPHVYRMLQGLMDSMIDAGSDIWSLTALESVKDLMQQELSTVISGIRIQKEANVTEDNTEEDYSRERQIQLLFDTLFLNRALQCRDESQSDSLSPLASNMEKVLELDPSSCERLHKSALGYWKKTHLLFGLLE